MISLYVLVRFLYNNHSIICFSWSNYFDHQLLSHSRTDNYLNLDFHHKICTLYLPPFLCVQLSSHQLWSSSSYFHMGRLFSEFLTYSCNALLKIIDSFSRTVSSSTNLMRSWRLGSCKCLFLIVWTSLFHLSISQPGIFAISMHNVSGVSNAFQFWLPDILSYFSKKF